MKHASAEAFVRTFYRDVLHRDVTPKELRQAVRAVLPLAGQAADMLGALVALPEVRRALGIQSRWPGGHYYSPVVDPDTVRDYIEAERRRPFAAVPGVELDFPAMRALWLSQLDVVKATPFRAEPTPGNRYRGQGGPYPVADAVILRMMLHRLRPRRIIEIGSGYSTACILDSLDHFGLDGVSLTCVEPAAARLRSLLRDGDLARIELIEKPIQQVPTEIVDALGPNDVLLIDSTHVLKTGSDVHHELFNILPRLAAGVFVHVHDIMPGFEYPDAWILQQNYSWNEAYAWRAFLMYNTEFRVAFWNAPFARTYRAELMQECPLIFPNPGSAIWVERVGKREAE